MSLYNPDWEVLAVALKRVVGAADVSEHQAQTDICHAIADKKIALRVVIAQSHIPDRGKTFQGGNVGVPPRLHPSDFDWPHSRPVKPWSIGPTPGQHYTWIGGWQDRPISLIELSTADVRAVLCEAASTATEAVTTQRPNSTRTSKSNSNSTPRKRTKPIQYQIKKAVAALAKERGGKFPPDDMPVFERDKIIKAWLDGDDDPANPSESTLRKYFSKLQR